MHTNTERSSGERTGNPLQYSCLENPRDRRAWWATVEGIAKEYHMTQQLNNKKPVVAVLVLCSWSGNESVGQSRLMQYIWNLLGFLGKISEKENTGRERACFHLPYLILFGRLSREDVMPETVHALQSWGEKGNSKGIGSKEYYQLQLCPRWHWW